MNHIVKRASFSLIIFSICLIGFLSICVAVKELLLINNKNMILELATVGTLFFIFSPWVVSLPSGASWRPGIAFILFSILYFDYKLVILIAIPGMLLSLNGKKHFLFEFLLTMGHLSLGIYAAGFMLSLMENSFTSSIHSYLAIISCIFVHFCINRLFAAFIVAFKKKRNLLSQLALIKNDLNWGYFCTYNIGILLFLIYRVYDLFGLLIVACLLAGIYKSFTYFQKLKLIEKKAYFDCLTNAENRASWEEFVKQIDTKRIYKSGIVFMLDLDNFKVINDTYGHSYGDRILQEFVSYMKRELKKGYRLFRYGGDEFVLFIQCTDAEYSSVCENIHEVISTQNRLWKKNGLPVSISFGNAFYSRNKPFLNIVRSADKLMYLNKYEKKSVRKGLIKENFN